MDKLISANAVITILENARFRADKDLSKAYLIADLQEQIERLPAAFDKEKIIEDLKDWKEDAEKWAAKYDEIGRIDKIDIRDAEAWAFGQALETVGKGGVE